MKDILFYMYVSRENSPCGIMHPFGGWKMHSTKGKLPAQSVKGAQSAKHPTTESSLLQAKKWNRIVSSPMYLCSSTLLPSLSHIQFFTPLQRSSLSHSHLSRHSNFSPKDFHSFQNYIPKLDNYLRSIVT